MRICRCLPESDDQHVQLHVVQRMRRRSMPGCDHRVARSHAGQGQFPLSRLRDRRPTAQRGVEPADIVLTMQTSKTLSYRGIVQARRAAAHSQRGIVLFVALIVMVALSLAGLALVRSIDTTSSVTGNIAFRQAALLQANWAVEEAVAHLYTGDTKLAAGAMIDPTTDAATQYYVAYFDPTKDSTKAAQPALPSGVPDVLWKKSGAWPQALTA